MLSWVTFTLLAGAAVSSIVVTGCFLMGFSDEWKQATRERQAKELSSMDYQTICDMFWNNRIRGDYPSELVRDEYHKRRKEHEELETFQRLNGMMTLNEMRTMMWHAPTATVQVNQAGGDSSITAVQTNVVGNTFYSDGEPYLTIPETYGTDERR